MRTGMTTALLLAGAWSSKGWGSENKQHDFDAHGLASLWPTG